MSQQNEAPAQASPAPAEKLLRIVQASWMTQVTYVAAELRIPDLLAPGPLSTEKLARATECHAPSLQRLLRAMVTLELCEEQEDGAFALTPLGALLRAEGADSLHAWTLLWGKYLWPGWGHLLYSVKTGESARKLLIGTETFEHLEQDRERAAVFNRAMTELTRLVARVVLRVYDFSGLQRIVDVGGGYGELLAAILTACPTMHGVLFDMPHAIEKAPQHLENAGVQERCELIAGSFFESVPHGGDAYLLKSIIVDWNDERCLAILRTCRAAMSGKAKLVLVERIMPERLSASSQDQVMAWSDLNMLLGPGGRERTEAEFRHLLGDAGFRLARIIPAGFNFSVIEGIPTRR
jgi:hypothetical protein